MLRQSIIAGIAITAAVGVASAQQVGIGTMGQGTAAYSMATAITRVIEEKTDLSGVVQPAAGTSSYLPLLQTGELDFAIANEIETAAAVNGEEPYSRALDGIRVVSILYPLHVGIFVREDSEIESISDLEGRRLTYGYTSQTTIASVVDALLATGGLTNQDVEQVLVPNVVRGADDFASGAADAAFFAVGGGKVAEVDAAVGGVRFIPLPDTEEAQEAMRQHVPASYIGSVDPAPSRTGVSETMPVMSYDYVLLAGAHVPDETVRAVVEALAESKDLLTSTFAAFEGFEPSRMHREISAPYHDGALAYYQASGSADAQE